MKSPTHVATLQPRAEVFDVRLALIYTFNKGLLLLGYYVSNNPAKDDFQSITDDNYVQIDINVKKSDPHFSNLPKYNQSVLTLSSFTHPYPSLDILVYYERS